VAHEELVTQRLAQPLQRVAGRGLGHGQAVRGAGEVAFGHHGVEDAQQVQVEGAQVHRGRRARRPGAVQTIEQLLAMRMIPMTTIHWDEEGKTRTLQALRCHEHRPDEGVPP
jgi:hypothetical protein